MLHPCYQIRPYQSNELWFFDDPKVGLYREGLTDGVPEVLIEVCRRSGLNPQNFLLKFSDRIDFKFNLRFEEPLRNGSLYWWLEGEMNCWFCPALLCYFPEPPQSISFQVSTGTQIYIDPTVQKSESHPEPVTKAPLSRMYKQNQ